MRFYKEGDIMKNGFNFYRLGDRGSVGFHFRWNDTLWTFRWSKSIRQFIYNKIVLPANYDYEGENV